MIMPLASLALLTAMCLMLRLVAHTKSIGELALVLCAAWCSGFAAIICFAAMMDPLNWLGLM